MNILEYKAVKKIIWTILNHKFRISLYIQEVHIISMRHCLDAVFTVISMLGFPG